MLQCLAQCTSPQNERSLKRTHEDSWKGPYVPWTLLLVMNRGPLEYPVIPATYLIQRKQKLQLWVKSLSWASNLKERYTSGLPHLRLGLKAAGPSKEGTIDRTEKHWTITRKGTPGLMMAFFGQSWSTEMFFCEICQFTSKSVATEGEAALLRRHSTSLPENSL